LMLQLILWANSNGYPVVLYTNRKLLLEQTSRVLNAGGIAHGIRASGFDPSLLKSVQLSMIQTEETRVYKKKQWALHHAKIVIVDEAHNQGGKTACKIFDEHSGEGGAVIGFTATPLEIGHVYTHLVVAGKNSELRACGAHVPCKVYGPDEPDTRKLKRQLTGEFTYEDTRKVIMTPTIFGRVYENWKKLNPDARPAILFAPGVKESIWFAEEFEKKGVRVAHIDGEDIYLDGKSYSSTREGRDDVLAQINDGTVKIVMNRFVLREGLDVPALYHGIFATLFGSLTGFLQSGGRLLRSHPSLDHVVLQDHGGSWHRHGSINADRVWRLDMTNHIATSMREQDMRDHPEKEPILCAKCGAVRNRGAVCPTCGFEFSKRSRPVIQIDGTLKVHDGPIYKPLKVLKKNDTEAKWKSIYFRARKSRNGMTFRQALGLFYYEHHYYPPNNLPFMPKEPIDSYRRVKDVPTEKLHGPSQTVR
jgi:superfamily II DNA or RNA helicase